jgi:signal transduction histidine kinase/ligand-binding sensor domain-containing protein
MMRSMTSVPRRRRLLILPAVLFAGVVLMCSPCADALDPALDVNQYGHTSWKSREGYFQHFVGAITQTPDGYLWVGTSSGLLRFDGVRTVPWQPPANQPLPSTHISSLLAGRDGTLWVGTWEGLASWKDGKLTQYPELAGRLVLTLLEDREGTVWAGGFSYSPPGRLCAIHSGSVQCYGRDGTLGNGVLGLYQDSNGTLWAGSLTGLWRWKPGPRKFYPIATRDYYGIQGLSGESDGSLLIAISGGIARFTDGKIGVAYPYPSPMQHSQALKLLRDRNDGLWVGTVDRGLVHIHQGRTDVFSQSDGLSGDPITAIFEDREGNIWVGTPNGLDRFRDVAVATFSGKQGISTATHGSVLAARDGSVWFDGYDGLGRWNNGQITIYHDRTTPVAANGLDTVAGVRKISVNGFPKPGTMSLLQDRRGRIWVSGLGGTGYLEDDRFISIRGVPDSLVYSIAEDAAGDLWIGNLDHGLFQLRGGAVVQQIPWARLRPNDHALALTVGPVQGDLWLGFFEGGVANFKDGQIRASYTGAQGLGGGHVNDLLFDHDGTLWAATEGGLSRLKDGRVTTLSSKNGLPCDAVLWVTEDDAHSLWLSTACGLIHMERSEVDAWSAAVDSASGSQSDHPKRTIHFADLDSSDGVGSSAFLSSSIPQVSKSPDGKLWFVVTDGISVFDPRHLPFNKLPPPVHIEQVTADRKIHAASFPVNGDAHDRMRLPALLRDLEIDYTGLSLVAAEKVRFRYKLEGWDRDWQDVATRRQAFYTNLSPGKYRFRVTACNNSGVWNEEGAFLDFSVAPAYYQTNWFRALCVMAFLGLLWIFYQLRLRQLRRQFSVGLEARVNERTRIARELHDTLLQSLHGLMFEFQAALNMLPRSPEKARQTLEEAISGTEEAIAESRDAIHDLRLKGVAEKTLAQLLDEAAGEMGGLYATNQKLPNFRVIVEGETQILSPVVQDEVYRIAREVMRNAFRHAAAGQIEAEIRYDKNQLRLRLRDDGKGIDPGMLEQNGRPGHWGLPGVRERAQRIGSRLEFWSQAGAGTEIELTVPASIAYESARDVARFELFRKGRKS